MAIIYIFCGVAIIFMIVTFMLDLIKYQRFMNEATEIKEWMEKLGGEVDVFTIRSNRNETKASSTDISFPDKDGL